MISRYKGLVSKVKFADGSTLSVGENVNGLKVVSIDYMFPEITENTPHCVEVSYSDGSSEIFFELKSIVLKKVG